MKKLLPIFLVLVVVISISVSACANGNIDENDDLIPSIEEIDDLLREANMPESEITEMDDELKRFIYENTFSEAKAEYIKVEKDESSGISLISTGYAISENELKLSVTAFKVEGAEQVDIYPSYEWLVPTKPNGKDWFGYSTHESYSVVPSERSNLIWYKWEKEDNWTNDGPATYTGVGMTGYQHFGDSLGTPDFPIYLRGNFYYRVDIDVDDPVKKIALAYVHDTSGGDNVSYSVGYGPLSIDIVPSSDDVGYLNNAFYLVY